MFAPLALTSIDTVRALFARGRADSQEVLDASLEKAWLTVGSDRRWGTHLYRPDPDSAPNRDFVPQSMTAAPTDFWASLLSDRAPAVWDQHAVVHLTRTEAKELQRQLSRIVAGLADQAPSRHRKPYVVQLGLAPLVDDHG